jgi:hypothetical protein
MDLYCKNLLIPGIMALDPPVPSKEFKEELPPTQFTIEHSTNAKRASPQMFTIEAEYQRYVCGEHSSPRTEILQYWEVSF